MNWYVLYTSARAEKQVEQRLKLAGIETYLPLHRSRRKWSDRVKVVEVPLFNSYVFVRCEEHKLRELMLIYGVSRAVYYLGKPAVVRDVEIDAIKEFLQIAHERELITNGDEVRIMSGVFEDQVGKVLFVNDKCACLYLAELGAKVCVNKEGVIKI